MGGGQLIPLLDASAATEVRLPLWSDPVIIEANSAKSIKRYVASGDATALTVPAEATIVAIRALSAQELDAAEARAGRKPHFGTVVNARKQKARKGAGNISKPKGAQKFATFLDGLTDSEATALKAYERWESAKFQAIALAGCSRVEQSDGQVFEFPEFMVLIRNPSLRASIVGEVGFRVQALSGLGERPKGLPGSVSGSEKPSESAAEHGAVTSAPTGCDDSVATAAATSQPS